MTTANHILKRAADLSETAYWYGGKGEIANEKLLKRLSEQYPDMWPIQRVKIAREAHVKNKVRVGDCSWLVCAAYRTKQKGSSQIRSDFRLYSRDISKRKPGMILWKSGHVGLVAADNKHVVEMRSFTYGYSTSRLIENCGFREVLMMDLVSYDPSDNDTSMRWVKKEGTWFFLNDLDEPAFPEGWHIINNRWWYLYADGHIHVGYLALKGGFERYYIDQQQGCLKTNENGTLMEWNVCRNEDGSWRTITT